MKKFHDKESAPKKYASLFNLDIPKENQMSVDVSIIYDTHAKKNNDSLLKMN